MCFCSIHVCSVCCLASASHLAEASNLLEHGTCQACDRRRSVAQTLVVGGLT